MTMLLINTNTYIKFLMAQNNFYLSLTKIEELLG